MTSEVSPGESGTESRARRFLARRSEPLTPSSTLLQSPGKAKEPTAAGQFPAGFPQSAESHFEDRFVRLSRPASIRTPSEPRGARCMLGSINTGGCCHLVDELRRRCCHQQQAPPRPRSHPYSAIPSIPRRDSPQRRRSPPDQQSLGMVSSRLQKKLRFDRPLRP